MKNKRSLILSAVVATLLILSIGIAVVAAPLFEGYEPESPRLTFTVLDDVYGILVQDAQDSYPVWYDFDQGRMAGIFSEDVFANGGESIQVRLVALVWERDNQSQMHVRLLDSINDEEIVELEGGYTETYKYYVDSGWVDWEPASDDTMLVVQWYWENYGEEPYAKIYGATVYIREQVFVPRPTPTP